VCESEAGVLCVHYSLLVTLHKTKYVIFNNILPFIFTPEKEQGAKSERGVKLYKKSNPVDSIFLSIYLSLRNAALLAPTVIIKLTRIQERERERERDWRGRD